MSEERPASAPLVNVSDEDAAVKSLRKLLWVLWGIGWIVVPLVFGEILNVDVAIPREPMRSNDSGRWNSAIIAQPPPPAET